MTTTPAARKHGMSVLGGLTRVLLLGAAAAALSAATVSAETGEARTPEPAQVTAPSPEIGSSRDAEISTGAIANDPAVQELQDSVTPAAPVVPTPTIAAPEPVVVAPGPIPAAIASLIGAQGPAALKMSKADREAVTAFYAAREDRPVWIDGDRLSSKAEAARTRIAASADDALDPRDFRLPTVGAGATPADLARADLEMSLATLTYARKAWGGRVSPTYVSPSITAQPSPFDAQGALASLESSHDVAATLEGFNPQHPQFQELRKLLAAARADRSTEPELPKIAGGKLLEPGAEDPRVPALRTRLGLTGSSGDLYYDSELMDAVIAFQKKNKLGASGLVNRQTVRALNAVSRPHDDADLIEINMERWRWMPRDLGPKHVFVDVPVFQLHIMQDGRSVYDTRVIVGKAANQTPIFSNAISHIIVNPYWNVPSTIALKEMQGSSLKGFEVVDSRGRPAELDWEGIRTNRLRIRQPPGERNALGHIKFMFPNSHSVYLHDTSSRSLFSKNDRAMSHGCVRVDRPLEFADALSGDQGLSGAKLKSMVGGKERRLNLDTPIPVHLTYFTAWVGDDGKIETRDDIYALDGRLKAALRGEPLPKLPEEAAPKVMVKAKPKPAPAVAEAVLPPEPQRVAGPANWLQRIFGSTR